MIVVSDTSAISNLMIIGEVDLLRLTFSRVIIPDAIYIELCKIAHHKTALQNLTWIERRSLSELSLFQKLRANLDEG